MQNLFENLNISDELKEELSEKFESAINEKAEELAESKAQSLFESKKESFLTETAEKLDDYLNIIAEEYASDLKESKESELKVQQAETIIEGVGAVLTAAGIDIASIVTIAKEGLQESAEKEDGYFDLKKENDNLVNEKLELEKEKTKLIKAGLVYQVSLEEGLSLMQVEKVKSLVGKLDESLSLEEFNESLKEIVSNIDESAKESLEESVEETKTEEKPFIPSHLI